MSAFQLARRAGALLIPIALVLTACGGSTTSGAPTGTAGPGTSAAPPNTAATPTPAPPSAAGTIGPSVIAIPSFDIGRLTAGLANVDSYRVSVTLKGVEQYKGVVVTKPVLSRDLTVGGKTRIVVIGNEAWMGEDGAPLIAVPGTLATQMFAAYDPTLLVGAFSGAGWAQSSLDQGTEEKNGVSAKHYHIDSTTAAGGFTGIPAGASIDVWIADEGYLVALDATGFPSGDMSIQVTGVDDPANAVERPS